MHELLGEMIIFNNDTFEPGEWKRLFEESVIPKGSEGSLQYFIFNNIEGGIDDIPNKDYYSNVNIVKIGRAHV